MQDKKGAHDLYTHSIPRTLRVRHENGMRERVCDLKPGGQWMVHHIPKLLHSPFVKPEVRGRVPKRVSVCVYVCVCACACVCERVCVCM